MSNEIYQAFFNKEKLHELIEDTRIACEQLADCPAKHSILDALEAIRWEACKPQLRVEPRRLH